LFSKIQNQLHVSVMLSHAQAVHNYVKSECRTVNITLKADILIFLMFEIIISVVVVNFPFSFIYIIVQSLRICPKHVADCGF
jgi:hypothetical protein